MRGPLKFSAAAAVMASQKALDVPPSAPPAEEPVPADPNANWRTCIAKVEAEFAGRVGAGLSRQEARKLKRTIAGLEASEARRNARAEARVTKKSRRAQRAVARAQASKTAFGPPMYRSRYQLQ